MMKMTRIFPTVSLSHVESDEEICKLMTKKNEVILVDVDFKQFSTTKIRTFRGQEITVKDGAPREPIRVQTGIQILLLLKDEQGYHRRLCKHVQSRYKLDSDACSHVVTSLTSFARKVHADRGMDDEGKVFKIEGHLGLVMESVCEERVPNAFEIESSCAICLDELSARGECTRTPCSHIFHDCCLLPWLDRHNTCPICRTIIH